jgi:prepilin-type N-terminal cleavage/methylation domain-containing protein
MSSNERKYFKNKEVKGMKLKPLKNAGFSLIEIIVVLMIIAIIMAVAGPAYQAFMRQGRVTTATSDATQLASAINTFNLTVAPGDMITEAHITEVTRAATAATLRPALIARNLFPQLSAGIEGEAGFARVLANLEFVGDTRMFRPVHRDELDLTGY